jgi:fibrillarin-like pre-rRNA processing protein
MQGRQTTLIWQDGILLSPGKILPGDRVHNGMRIWLPEKSKVAALCHLNGDPPIRDARILYLGAASGTTVSFLSDYAEVIYAVEFSPRPVRSLVRLARQRSNIIPFFMDARNPERYLPFVEPVDILIQDIAQRDQVEIVIKNLCMLKKGGNLILFLKMLSMGVLKEYEEIIDMSITLLKKAGITHMQVIQLEKYHTGHVAITGVYCPKQ